MEGRLEERLSRAINTRDLSADDSTIRQDSDYLGALAFASRRWNSSLRLHTSGSQADYKEARKRAVDMALSIGMARRWGLSHKHLVRIGELALAHHVFPVCPDCKGVKFVVPEGSPYPSSAICQECQGTGRRLVQRRWHHEINEVMLALLAIDQNVARSTSRYLG